MPPGIVHFLLLFICGWLIGMGGMAMLFIITFSLLRRRSELLLQNEEEGITPRFQYDEEVRQIFFDVEECTVIRTKHLKK
ncbi:hypothetical protein [Aneurinibacillus tyrosinisolvens]|uniref:hypothetical protein n=1 Tax=Aneurinibacillus tyrosinisolvens TaxID=1443435 RepID=UPI00063F3778|nr:hypothetical protein [Aneurinibacillus tyrosinisolvens]